MRLRVALASLILASCSTSSSGVRSSGDPALSFPNETRISNLRQLTFGGTNAEAYWSFDGRSLTYQHSGPETPCDQIYTISADGKMKKRISNGQGRTTCAYYSPDNDLVLYSSTHASDKRCPPEPDKSAGYVWPIYPTYQFYRANKDGTDILPAEPGAPTAYNAELTACKDGKVVFTSDRNGDLDLYVGRLDSKGMITQVKQVTNTLGYDGGAFFSPDCSKLVWRASRPRPGKETEEYVRLLRKHLVKPGELEIWMADADGTNARQVTRLKSAAFAPYFTPDNSRILFSSNLKNRGSRNFDIFMIRTNGTELEQITDSKTFDSFPMFSPDGKYLAFSSNRNARKPRETNIFIADWNGRLPGPLLTDEDPDAANRWYAIARELSSSDMEGRGVGTEGLNRAEAYAIDLYGKIGMKELGGLADFDNKLKGYEQPVEIVTGVDADWTNTILKADWRHLKGKEEFAPAAFSSLGELKGQMLDVGYGIVAPELGIDDYTGKDAKGKVVLIRRRIPPALKLTAAQESNYGDMKYKAFLARERGANAVIFWEPEGDDKKPENLLFSLDESDGEVSSDSGIPVLFVPRKIAREWIAAPKPVIVSGNVALTKKKTMSSNIVGYLGDSARCRKDPVVIGAHIDHLGRGGGSSSLETGFARKTHYGADDNASGVASMIEAARIIRDTKADGCFIFAAFTGEEIGVVGSSKFVDLLRKVKIQPRAMLNLDMVGRMKNNSLVAFGTASAKEWSGILKNNCENRSLKCTGTGDGYGPSDHMPFYIAKVPVLHFFTGPHTDYHRSSDTVDKLNATGGVQIAELVAGIATDAAKRTLTYQQSKTSSTMGSIRSRGDRKGKGAYLGSVPDYAQMTGGPAGVAGSEVKKDKDGKPLPPVKGVRLAGVRAGSPAEEGGLAEGDVITSIVVLDEEPGYAAVQPKTYAIQNLQDYSFVLSNLKPGMRIRVTVQRKDRTLDLNLVVGRRTDGK